MRWRRCSLRARCACCSACRAKPSTQAATRGAKTNPNKSVKHMEYLTLMSAREAAAAIRAKEITSLELVDACLRRIDEREPTVNAWAFIDPERARGGARACDAAEPSGPLHGVPVGIKDVIDTCDMPTEYGSTIHRGHLPSR